MLVRKDGHVGPRINFTVRKYLPAADPAAAGRSRKRARRES